jgi:hypothetical protein
MMKNRLSILAVCLGFAAAWQCDTQPTQHQEAVPPPYFVLAPDDTTQAEYGVDAIPESDAIFLQWQRATVHDRFRLFRRTRDEKSFTFIATLSGADTTFIDPVAVGIRCYYYLIAGDEGENWSAPSDTVDYLLIDKAAQLKVLFGPPIEFQWQFQGTNPGQYILRLVDEESAQLVWLSLVRSAYQGPQEKANYNWDGEAKEPVLVSGRRYRWRIDCRGSEKHSGSESVWQRFIVP